MGHTLKWHKQDLLKRLITGSVLVLVLLFSLMLHPILWKFCILSVGSLIAFEWGKLFFQKENKILKFLLPVSHFSIILALILGGFWLSVFILCLFSGLYFFWFFFLLGSGKRPQIPFWSLLGLYYISLAGISAIVLVESSAIGEFIILWLLIVVWVTDSSAFLFGKMIGGKKIFPSISPNKTWSGAICGLTICVIVAGFLFPMIYKASLYFPFLLLSILFSLVAQCGDFFESWIKRYWDVKDAGSLLPGHGGFFDRFDSLYLCLICFSLLELFLRISQFWENPL